MDVELVRKKWVACIVKTRRGDIKSEDKLCLGDDPKPKTTSSKNELDFCNDVIWIRTYVNANFVSFCKTHSPILHDYLTLSSKSQIEVKSE